MEDWGNHSAYKIHKYINNVLPTGKFYVTYIDVHNPA